MAFGSYSAGVSKAYSIIGAMITISKIIVYVVFVILAFVSNDDVKLSNDDEKSSKDVKSSDEQDTEEIVIE